MIIHVFGEILWDVFTGSAGAGDSPVSRERRLGGAPFNLAAHAARRGARVTLISALGRDELGRQALARARHFGVDTSAIAESSYPTGVCEVTLRGGQPSYSLLAPAAYDDIPFPAVPARADALCYGTLASRGERSAETLRRLLREGEYREIFCDLNIRPPHWSPEGLSFAIAHATLLKLSREEMGALETLPGGGIGGSADQVARQLPCRFPRLRRVVLTLGADGAILYRPSDGALLRAPMPRGKPVSTVGAGDAFSAAYLTSYLAGEGDERALAKASALADIVVGRIEAIPEE